MTILKRIIVLFLLIGMQNHSYAQEKNSTGFYFQPFYSSMFLENHVGNAIGTNIGIRIPKSNWEIGIRYYGRSGPINEHISYELQLPDGQTYKGKSSLQLGADHGYTGLEVAYTLHPKTTNWSIRFPISFGSIGAGFYLKGEDRETPDGRRVSEWEDEFQEGSDAGFGLQSEIGVQAFYRISDKFDFFQIGGGIHYANTFGYQSFLGGDDFYNNKLRAAFGIRVSF